MEPGYSKEVNCIVSSWSIGMWATSPVPAYPPSTRQFFSIDWNTLQFTLNMTQCSEVCIGPPAMQSRQEWAALERPALRRKEPSLHLLFPPYDPDQVVKSGTGSHNNNSIIIKLTRLATIGYPQLYLYCEKGILEGSVSVLVAIERSSYLIYMSQLQDVCNRIAYTQTCKANTANLKYRQGKRRGWAYFQPQSLYIGSPVKRHM